MSVLRYLVTAGAVAGAGYVAYRIFTRPKAVEIVEPASSLIQTGVMAAEDVQRLVELERAAEIPGLARFLAAVGATESNWASPTRYSAHNDSASEVNASAAAVKGGLDRGLPPLGKGSAAAEFGSGGLFGLLAPYALWAGGPDYPLVDRPPEIVFDPKIAGAIAADMVKRLRKRGIASWDQMKVAWKGLGLALGDPTLASKVSQQVLARAEKRAKEQGLDPTFLDDPIDVSAYPGLTALLARLG